MKGKQVIGTLERIKKGRIVSTGVEKVIRSRTVLSSLSHVSKTWLWNPAQQV